MSPRKLPVKDETNSTFTQEVGDYICLRLARGDAVRVILRENGMPSSVAFYSWLKQYPEFLVQYQNAREIQADTLADEILEIADDGRNDWMASNDPNNPGYKQNGEHYNRSRLRVDSRKWYASKVAPKKYGERITQDINAVVRVEKIEVSYIDPKPPQKDRNE